MWYSRYICTLWRGFRPMHEKSEIMLFLTEKLIICTQSEKPELQEAVQALLGKQ